MDILAVLDRRLNFIARFYERAAAPFESIQRAINAGEEPYVSRGNPEDYDGHEYLEEGTEAEDCLDVLGHCCLMLVQKALQDYLREFILREERLVQPDEVLTAQLKRYAKGRGLFHGYCRYLEERTRFEWSRSPVPQDRIEQINLCRNDIAHDPSIEGGWIRQSREHFRRFPESIFADEFLAAVFRTETDAPEIPAVISVTGEKLSAAIEDIRTFCTFVEAQRPDKG